jgi:hypothetical protein
MFNADNRFWYNPCVLIALPYTLPSPVAQRRFFGEPPAIFSSMPRRTAIFYE